MENPFKFGTIVEAEYFTAQTQASPRLRVNAIEPLGEGDVLKCSNQ